MPTYEYACKKCDEHLEVVQSFKDEPLTVCPNCGGELRKVFGSIGIAFKGSGFYKTDSRPGKKPSGESKSAGDSMSSGDSKSAESKPAESKPASTSTSTSTSTESKSASA
jgi:putative FmdB family regulatory protein